MSRPADIRTLDRLLAQVSHLHHDRARTLFNTVGLYRGQPPVLHILEDHEGLSHSELAARLGVRASTVSKMLDRMEKAGFLTSQPDPVDQRVSRVYLTDKGRAVHGELDMLFGRVAEETFAGLQPDEVDALYELLLRVRGNLARTGAPDPGCGP